MSCRTKLNEYYIEVHYINLENSTKFSVLRTIIIYQYYRN